MWPLSTRVRSKGYNQLYFQCHLSYFKMLSHNIRIGTYQCISLGMNSDDGLSPFHT